MLLAEIAVSQKQKVVALKSLRNVFSYAAVKRTNNIVSILQVCIRQRWAAKSRQVLMARSKLQRACTKRNASLIIDSYKKNQTDN